MKKLLCSLLSLAILVESAPAAPMSPAGALSLAIPARVGYITDHFVPPNQASGKNPDVILIQDLHVNRSVQINISKILKSLKTSGLLPQQVAMEGAAGPVDVAFMQNYPDAVVRRQAADYLLTQGEMPGHMHFLVTEGQGGLYGVETPEIYNAVIELYRKAHQERQDLGQKLTQINRALRYLSHDKNNDVRANTTILQRDIDVLTKLVSQQVPANELKQTLRAATRAVDHLQMVLPTPEARALLEPVSASINYYVLALMRDGEMFTHLMELRAADKQSTTVLVMGGFHTSGMTDLLKKQGLSYAVITPTVPSHTSVDEKLYDERMMGHHFTSEQISTGRDWASMLTQAPLDSLENETNLWKSGTGFFSRIPRALRRSRLMTTLAIPVLVASSMIFIGSFKNGSAQTPSNVPVIVNTTSPEDLKSEIQSLTPALRSMNRLSKIMQVSPETFKEVEAPVREATFRIYVLFNRPGGRSALNAVLKDKAFMADNQDSTTVLLNLSSGKTNLLLFPDSKEANILNELAGGYVYPKNKPSLALRTEIWDAAMSSVEQLTYDNQEIDRLIDVASSGDAESLSFLMGKFGDGIPTPKNWEKWRATIAERTWLPLSALEGELLKLTTPDGKNPADGKPLTEYPSGLLKAEDLRSILKANLSRAQYAKYENSPEVAHLRNAKEAIDQNFRNAKAIKDAEVAEAKRKAQKEADDKKATELAEKLKVVQKPLPTRNQKIAQTGLWGGLAAVIASLLGFIKSTRTGERHAKKIAEMERDETGSTSDILPYQPSKWPTVFLVIGTGVATAGTFYLFGKVAFLPLVAVAGIYFLVRRSRPTWLGLGLPMILIALLAPFSSLLPHLSAQDKPLKPAAELIYSFGDLRPEIAELTTSLRTVKRIKDTMQVSESGIGEKELLIKTATSRILILLGRPGGRSELKNLLADKEFQKTNLESLPILTVLQSGGKPALRTDDGYDLSKVIYSLDGLSLYPSPGSPADQLRTMVWDSANLGDNPHNDLQYSEVIIDQLLDFVQRGDPDSLQFLYGQFGTNTPKYWPQWKEFIAERTILKLATLEVNLLKVVTAEGKDSSGMPFTIYPNGMKEWGYLRGVLKANLPTANYQKYEGASEIQHLLNAQRTIQQNIKNAEQAKKDAQAKKLEPTQTPQPQTPETKATHTGRNVGLGLGALGLAGLGIGLSMRNRRQQRGFIDITTAILGLISIISSGLGAVYELWMKALQEGIPFTVKLVFVKNAATAFLSAHTVDASAFHPVSLTLTAFAGLLLVSTVILMKRQQNAEARLMAKEMWRPLSNVNIFGPFRMVQEAWNAAQRFFTDRIVGDRIAKTRGALMEAVSA